LLAQFRPEDDQPLAEVEQFKNIQKQKTTICKYSK